MDRPDDGVKRLPVVLEAFRGLLADGADATLCLVGEGPDRDEIERLARRLGIARSCLFVGYQRDVAPYYRLIDVLVLASANEGTPVVAIEALAAGRPVVSTDVGGVADVVRDGVDGLLVPPEDPRRSRTHSAVSPATATCGSAWEPQAPPTCPSGTPSTG